ncbi:ankyrin repeat domain-containing protein [Paludibaculum fermentans]|uniref:ankyrin repeat domain-containing protein n=1 Tax=Paludibaculum fermentans TaxID=1473598 RepID=UPI003EC05D0E
MKLLFWIIVLCDLAGIFLMFLLGLAAATSSKTNALSVAGFMLVVPGLVLGLSIFLFHGTSSRLLRGTGFLLAMSPVLILVLLKGYTEAEVRLNSDSKGNMTFFRSGPTRDMATAISQNDAATVAALAPKVDINSRGFSDITLLMLAFRQLRVTPDRLEVLRALMKAGADPNIGSGGELPLSLAIQLSSETGPEPVTMLLAAGAKPNAKNSFGTPVFFSAAGRTIPIEILKTVLEHGADLQARDSQGNSAVFAASTCSNWKAALLLLERGADWKQYRTPDGMGYKDMLDSHLRVYGDEPGLAEVIAFVRAH